MELLFLFTLFQSQVTSEEAAKEVCGHAIGSEARKFCGLSWRCWARLSPAQEKVMVWQEGSSTQPARPFLHRHSKVLPASFHTCSTTLRKSALFKH